MKALAPLRAAGLAAGLAGALLLGSHAALRALVPAVEGSHPAPAILAAALAGALGFGLAALVVRQRAARSSGGGAAPDPTERT